MTNEMTQGEAENYNPFSEPLYVDLEPGTYAMKIAGIEFKNVEGKGKKVTWKLTVADGKGKGKSVYNDFLLTWTNPDTQRIAREQYRRSLAAAGLYGPDDLKFKNVKKLVEEGTAKIVDPATFGSGGFPHMEAKGQMVLVTVSKDDKGYLRAKKIEGVKPELGDVATNTDEQEPPI